MDLLISFLCVWIPTIIANHAEIFYYRDVTTQTCGISKKPSQISIDCSCFDWHNLDDNESKMLKGRPALVGETPFTTLIKAEYSLRIITPKNISINRKDSYFICTGTIINPYWIITAKRCFAQMCLPENNCMKIDYIIYPELKSWKDLPQVYMKARKVSKIILFNGTHDIALAKLNRAIDMTNKENISTVCLPKANIKNTEEENALVYGCGLSREERLGVEYPFYQNDILPLGWTKILSPNSNNSVKDPDIITVNGLLFPFGFRGCLGDSGSPLIQYVDGRAVLIGILSEPLLDTVFCNREESAIMNYTRVSSFIHFITDTIKRN